MSLRARSNDPLTPRQEAAWMLASMTLFALFLYCMRG
jgi:hypothetical protein